MPKAETCGFTETQKEEFYPGRVSLPGQKRTVRIDIAAKRRV